MNDAPPGHWTDLRRTLRGLLLPIAHDREDVALEAVDVVMEESGIPPADRSLTLQRLYEDWREALRPSIEYDSCVNAVLRSGSSEYGHLMAGTYFDLHKRLRESSALTFNQASTLISYVDLIGHLASNHSMSAAQISTLLRARGPASDFPWAALEDVLRRLDLLPDLSEDAFEAQLASDLTGEADVFLDAGWGEALELVIGAGERLGFPGDLGSALASVAPSDSGRIHWPYVFMLHYSCTPLGFYDHPPVYIYEFAPRGRKADRLLYEYSGLAVGTNPFLNNAKSVDRLDRYWADSKARTNLRDSAVALVKVLDGIEGLTFPAKRELASLLRQWCLRQIRLHRSPPTQIPRPPTADAIQATLDALATGESHTRGIIEQRVVDAIAAHMHSDREQWRPRGLTDSVNAANAPRRKLGDCEFQDAARHVVEAYEAHAGTLTHSYLEGHTASLRGLIQRRLDDEWLAFSDAADWRVCVTFVAHQFDLPVPEPTKIHEVTVEFRFLTFDELATIAPPDQLIDTFSAHVHDPLNSARAPEETRQAYSALSRIALLTEE